MPIGINGSGTITGISAGGLPDATITQAELASGVAGNGPAFMAIQTTDQNVTTVTYTKVTLGNELFDTNNNFSGGTFTPTVAGYYQINGLVRGTTASNNMVNVLVAIYKNGALYSQSFTVTPATNGNFASISSLVYLNGTTDYVEMYGYLNGTSPFFDYISDGNCCQFSGFLARAA